MSNETVHRACDTLAGEIQPIDDIRSTAAYRKQVAVNLFRDFLSQLASREGQ
jgi:xanthine dehydrogenase iron-sulfur cluster and FAD-binding subunit A